MAQVTNEDRKRVRALRFMTDLTEVANTIDFYRIEDEIMQLMADERERVLEEDAKWHDSEAHRYSKDVTPENAVKFAEMMGQRYVAHNHSAKRSRSLSTAEGSGVPAQGEKP